MLLSYRLLIIFTVFLYCSNAYLFFFERGLISIKPLYWYFFTIGTSLALALLRPNYLLKEIPRSFIVWIWIFLCFTIFNFFYSSQSVNALQNLISRNESAALLISFIILFIFQQENGIRTAQFALLAVMLFGVIMNVIEFVTPQGWSNVSGRSAGLYVDPNISGVMLVLAMVASVSLISKTGMRLLYCLVAGIGIILTFSRGAWILWALAMMALGGTGHFMIIGKKYAAFLLGGVVGFILYSLFSGGFVEVFTDLGLSAHLDENTLQRLGAEGETFEDSSAKARAHVAVKAWQEIQEHPLLGYGLGFTRGHEWGGLGTHNMYLAWAVEGGLLGLAVYVSLLLVLWHVSKSIGKVLIALLSVYSLVNHNILDWPATLLIFALSAGIGKLQRLDISSKAREGDLPPISDRKVKSA
jgi:O-antigen ligase